MPLSPGTRLGLYEIVAPLGSGGSSPDNRTIYYGAARAEADIWTMERR